MKRGLFENMRKAAVYKDLKTEMSQSGFSSHTKNKRKASERWPKSQPCEGEMEPLQFNKKNCQN